MAQAEACFLEPEPDMNPILLKPNSDTGSQVVVNGKVWRNLPAREYYGALSLSAGAGDCEPIERLASRHEFIVMEGAGSITELNLKQTDLVNLGLATRLNVPVLLVADIDRGGVFASVVGTFAAAGSSMSGPGSRRSRSTGFAAIRRSLKLASSLLERRTGKPCVGVFPYLHDAPLDPEDGVAFEGHRSGRFRHRDHRPSAYFQSLGLPAAFRTRAGFNGPWTGAFTASFFPAPRTPWAISHGCARPALADWILEQHRRGARIVGICGGYQMMGERIEDPLAMESASGRRGRAWDCFPSAPCWLPRKPPGGCAPQRLPASLSTLTKFTWASRRGRTDAAPFATLSDGTPDGVRR